MIRRVHVPAVAGEDDIRTGAEFFFFEIKGRSAAGSYKSSSSVRFWGAAKSCQRKIFYCHTLEEGAP